MGPLHKTGRQPLLPHRLNDFSLRQFSDNVYTAAMRVHPAIIIIFLLGIFINSVGRLVLTPLHYPLGMPLTAIGYVIWASVYLYITLCAILSKKFNAHIGFWLVFTILAPIQYSASHGGSNTVNQATSAILITQLIIGSIIETKFYIDRKKNGHRD